MGVGRHIADKHSCQSGVGTRIYILRHQIHKKVTKVQDDDGKNQIFEILYSFSKQKSAKHRSSISSGLDSDKVQVLLKIR